MTIILIHLYFAISSLIKDLFYPRRNWKPPHIGIFKIFSLMILSNICMDKESYLQYVSCDAIHSKQHIRDDLSLKKYFQSYVILTNSNKLVRQNY